MQFTVRFYFAQDGTKPVLMLLEELRQKEPILHKLVVAGIKKIERSEFHGPLLTEMVDKEHGILELRVGSANIS